MFSYVLKCPMKQLSTFHKLRKDCCWTFFPPYCEDIYIVQVYHFTGQVKSLTIVLLYHSLAFKEMTCHVD